MPEHGIDWTPPPYILRSDEIVRLAKIFVGMGIRKIRLTGGEPLLRTTICDIATAIRSIPDLDCLAMTTNGIGLRKWAQPLHDAGLDSMTVSLDSLRPERFAAITRRDGFRDVMAGIEAALTSGFVPLKINIVVMRGINDDELVDFITWGRDRPVDLRFIEYMPFPDNHWSEAGLVSCATMRKNIGAAYELVPIIVDASAVGKSFSLIGHQAKVSFVASMTESFCGSCNRLRLTADGHVKACLFNPDERPLRDILRDGGSDADIADAIRAAVVAKQAAHIPMQELTSVHNRSMIAIGG
jgi:cyclic pyranopterin phosphate synthase